MVQKTGMAARYVEVTLDEMDKILKRAFRILRPRKGENRGEVYYDLKLGKYVGIRVWTSIRPRSGSGAGVGQDAIRVQLISLKDNGPLQKGKAPIVKRTQNWRDNLKKRVEELIDKYEDNEEFWENWAENRSRRGDPQKEMKRQEEQERKEEEERRSGPPMDADSPSEPARSTQREVPLEKLRGDATPKQLGFIRALLRNVNGHEEWRELGLDSVTGFDHIPRRDDLERLSKRDASQVIDILLKAGKGNRRYASEELAEVLSID
jgi:hypothetical protein